MYIKELYVKLIIENSNYRFTRLFLYVTSLKEMEEVLDDMMYEMEK